MNKRIGNDLTFTWKISRKNESSVVPENFNGKDVDVILLTPSKKQAKIDDITINTGVISFVFKGKNQIELGQYIAVLSENKGDDNMVTVDTINAVTLVPHSYMEKDGDDGDVIEVLTVRLTSTISAGGGGGIEQQQADWAQTDNTAVDYIKNKPTLAPVATSGSYNDLSNKPTIPAALVQSDWNETDTTSKAFILNKPTIPTVPTDVSAFNNDAGYITEGGVADKQDKMPIVQVASGTTAINAAVNTYYEVAGEVGTLAITLPTPTDLPKVAMVVIHLLAGTNPNVVIGSTETIDYSAAYDISASKEYEINCLYNGDKWVVADMEVV